MRPESSRTASSRRSSGHSRWRGVCVRSTGTCTTRSTTSTAARPEAAARDCSQARCRHAAKEDLQIPRDRQPGIAPGSSCDEDQIVIQQRVPQRDRRQLRPTPANRQTRHEPIHGPSSLAVSHPQQQADQEVGSPAYQTQVGHDDPRSVRPSLRRSARRSGRCNGRGAHLGSRSCGLFAD